VQIDSFTRDFCKFQHFFATNTNGTSFRVTESGRECLVGTCSLPKKKEMVCLKHDLFECRLWKYTCSPMYVINEQYWADHSKIHFDGQTMVVPDNFYLIDRKIRYTNITHEHVFRKMVTG